MRNFDELLDKYAEKFGEAFPVRMAPGSDEEIMDLIEECLESGTPYDPYADPDFDPEMDY